ncbi:pimeloyl-ACP methyl ester carboxylesterase [Amycolatopsis lexingtonensis]|uniref:Pimeloyl-ACP methyl ester carboxylesterase n=1 Tax=Amycolatopsis lexingtonensis TaxID=218822 RepID=A0ABR9HV09_9PSEU|nr:alpha/beta hydrolase [Amycolatopsis lexingtonensis]MBE1494745.1 pimeloyl-ACP methyl ester carboxylesterase [Amycolatopsis lexingtonensis]
MTIIGGREVAYTDHGGDGPVVVLLHSFLMDGRMFAAQLAAFEGFRCVTVDERGHGGTPADGPFDYWDVARDVLGVLDHLGIERAAVVGTSQGGFVALRLALLAPARISAIAVLGTSAAAEDPAVAAGYRAVLDAWVSSGAPADVLDGVARICFGDFDAPEWQERWSSAPHSQLTPAMNALVDRDEVLSRAGEISCPALVLHGSADLAYPVERAAELADALPAAEPLVVVEGGAHFLSFTHAAAVNPHLLKFLETHA